ncbi:MAG TPA: sugar transferase [Candidatus Paceibacterota bacterium]|nr:sugar transferase [Candidatus Paceibacterota bacterium]
MAFSRRETALLLIGDFLLLAVSLWVALGLRNFAFPAPSYFLENLTPFIPVFLFSLVVFYIAGLYEKPTRPARRAMGERIIGAQVANTLLAAVFFFVLPLSIAPKTILVIYLIISVAAITLWRFYSMSHVAPRERLAAVLVGHGAAVDEVAEELTHNDRSVVRLVARIDIAAETSEPLSARVKLAVSKGAQVVILDARNAFVARDLPALYGLMLHGIIFVDFSAFYEEAFERVPLGQIDYAWLLDCLPREHFIYDIVKRALDLGFATIGILMGMVVVVPSVLVLLATGGRPFIFHERIGRGGALFRIIKLRTMLFNDHGDPELQKQNRVTRFGRLLRKTRIDELPQLVNVLAGTLSFIGPRPELPQIARVYEQQVPYYHVRHLITPGLSGWAQIRDYDAPRGGADIERTRRKISYDLYYLKHRSLTLDLAITLQTLRALATFTGT